VTAGIRIADLTVAVGGKELVRGVSFAVPAGTVGAILGPSGAGKSTILRAIAGLVEPERGTIELVGFPVWSAGASVPPERRPVGMLFQNFALWSHLTARAHLTFALEGRRVPRAEWEGRIREVSDVLGLGPFLARRPAGLSGGERQRLALARALVIRPAALLLDEPTASVDPGAGREIRDYVRELPSRFPVTTLLVTHDQDEALSLAQSVLVLDRGEALQAGPPAELYSRPASPRVARFLGEGVFVPATILGGAAAETPVGAVAIAAGSATPPGGRGRVLLRPEGVLVGSNGDGTEAVVVGQSFLGPSWRLTLRVGDHEVLADVREPFAPGSRVRVRHPGVAPFFPEGAS
jgi:iron(III) transport system ATP-binding protein